jgi:hypothetical protein
MTIKLSRLALRVSVLLVILMTGVTITLGQDATAQPALPGLATATPAPALPGIATQMPVTEYQIGIETVNIPNSWKVWTGTSEQPPFAVIPYGVIAAQSPTGTIVQFALVPNQKVIESIKSAEPLAIFEAYKATQISKLTDQPIGLATINNQLWMLIPTESDLVIVTATSDIGTNEEALQVIGTVYPKGKILDNAIVGKIKEYIASRFQSAPTAIVPIEPVTTPEVASVNLKSFMPNEQQLGLGQEFVRDTDFSHTYSLEEMKSVLSKNFGPEFSSILASAAQQAGYINQEVVVWRSNACSVLEIDIINFQTTDGPLTYVQNQSVIDAWLRTGNYQNITNTQFGIEGSGFVTTACGQANSATVQVGYKNYLIAVSVVDGANVDTLMNVLYSVADFIGKQIG